MRVNKWVFRVFAISATAGLLCGCASSQMASGGPSVAAMSHRELDPADPGGALVAGPDLATALTESEPAPEPKAEAAPPSPGPDYVWVAGHWVRHNGWNWQPGYWIIPPASQAIWVPGRWLNVNGVQTWYDGYWL